MSNAMDQMMRELRKEATERSWARIEEEIGKRRELEEAVGCLEGKLNEAYKVIHCLEQMVSRTEQTQTSLLGAVRSYFQKKKQDKELLQKSMEYFAPVFDPQYYAEHNEDVRRMVGTNEEALLRNFILYGMYGARRAKKEFDVIAYMKCNPDIAKAQNYDFRRCFLHYITNGEKEGRTARTIR